MERVLVCGADGQLGSVFRVLTANKPQFYHAGKKSLDLTDKALIEAFVLKNKIQVIVNCSGYTAVDNAEEKPKKAELLNKIAVQNLAEICQENNLFLIHFSTDYVFDGMAKIPYKETDIPNPATIYGKTKLEGEKVLEKICSGFLIFRTSWLYSDFGHNFVKTILKLSEQRGELKVVDDQIGSPTNAYDLAHFIVESIESNSYKNNCGIFHFSNQGQCSWYEFAKEIIRIKGIDCKLLPWLSAEFSQKAKRPSFSVLDCSKLQKDFKTQIPPWQQSLAQFLLADTDSQ